MRLDKFLSHALNLPRAAAQRAIRAGSVTVDGAPMRDPAAHVRDGQRIELEGREARAGGPRYLMLNKPAGYICATADGEHPTVLDLLPPDVARGLHPAGRLDLDTTGLVLLTDDGAWSHRITSPRRSCGKRYRVTLAEPLTDAAEAMLRAGLLLHGEERPTLPAEIERIGERDIALTIREGRYHQVKRMLAAVGNHVTALHRERIGAIALDPALDAGAWRSLFPEEIAAF